VDRAFRRALLLERGQSRQLGEVDMYERRWFLRGSAAVVLLLVGVAVAVLILGGHAAGFTPVQP
jgi:hypothetical protein